jgi:hypothetical protein
MKSLDQIAALFSAHIERYIEFVSAMNDADLSRTAERGEWSIAQMIDHICATTEKCVGNALLCAEGKGERGHSPIGPAIFSMMGAFPPVKIKVRKIPPGLNAVYQPRQISKEEAIDQLRASVKRLKSAIPHVAKASRTMRIKHWAGGWFNAQQWLHSAEMHAKHHFRQLERLMKEANA